MFLVLMNIIVYGPVGFAIGNLLPVDLKSAVTPTKNDKSFATMCYCLLDLILLVNLSNKAKLLSHLKPY